MMFGVAPPQLIPLLVGGGLGGLLGWHILRARVWYSLYDEAPIGMTRQQYVRRQRRIALLKTAFRAVLCAAAGVLIAWSLSSMIR
jgi:hypothetical protein